MVGGVYVGVVTFGGVRGSAGALAGEEGLRRGTAPCQEGLVVVDVTVEKIFNVSEPVCPFRPWGRDADNSPVGGLKRGALAARKCAAAGAGSGGDWGSFLEGGCPVVLITFELCAVAR